MVDLMDIQDHDGLPEWMRLHQARTTQPETPQGFDAMCIERALEGVELTLAPERLVRRSSCISGDDRSVSRKSVGNAGLCRRGKRVWASRQRGWLHPRCVRSVVVNGPSVTGAWRSWPSRCLTALGRRDATTIRATHTAGSPVLS